ncbi:MAG: hypothetical protein LBF09_00685, partial [Odoribacteraceae bacterium]|nr:hypothetical protein [Odoribacteraceae bacterium]
TCHNAWKDPEKRNHEDVRRLQDAERDLLPVYYEFARMVMGNPLVTSVDLDDFGLPQRTITPDRKPAPVEKTPPRYWSVLMYIRFLTIMFGPAESQTKKGKPKGQHGVECRWLLLEHPREVTLDELIHSEFTTRSPLNIEFNDNERGWTVYYALRWENTRGEKGEFGPVLFDKVP